MAFAETILGLAEEVLPRWAGRIEAILEAERARLIAWLTVFFGAGIAVYFALSSEPSLILGAGLVALAAAIAVRFARERLLYAAAAMAILAGASGFLAGELRARIIAAPILTRDLGPVMIEGLVRSIDGSATRTRFVIDLDTVAGLSPSQMPARLRLSMRADANQFGPGDTIKTLALLRPPPAPVLPGAYDFARMAYFARIGAIGIALGKPQRIASREEDGLIGRVWVGIEKMRAAISARVRAHMSGDRAAITTALINGDRTQISEEINTIFRASGLQHLLSISGLHMSLVALGIFGVVRLLLAACEPLALRVPIKEWSAVFALIGSVFYLLLSGSSIPTVRSFVMIAIVLVAVLVGRRAFTIRNVALAALVLMAAAPETLLNVSFQMSFASVVALIVAHEAYTARRGPTPMPGLLTKPKRYLAGIALSSVVATFATAPFAVFHFHNFSGYGLPANMIAIPLVGFLVMPAATLALLLMPLHLETIPLTVMGFGVDLVLDVARNVAAWPGALTLVPAVSATSFLFIVGGGLWLCLWQTKWRVWGLAPITLGLALSLFPGQPDLLIDRDASHVAARGTDGALVFLSGRGGGYAAETLLERDADLRVHPINAARALPPSRMGRRCDSQGCVFNLANRMVVALSNTAEALADDCRRADIVIARIPARGDCNEPRLVIDRFDLWREGAHTVWVENGIKVKTVREMRGDRFWSPPPVPRSERKKITQ